MQVKITDIALISFAQNIVTVRLKLALQIAHTDVTRRGIYAKLKIAESSADYPYALAIVKAWNAGLLSLSSDTSFIDGHWRFKVANRFSH